MQEIVPGIGFTQPLDNPDDLLFRLEREIDLHDEIVDVGHGPQRMPRRTGWYGDPEAVYTYSGITNLPTPWTPALAELRERLNTALGVQLNSCLIGVYADGSDMVGWHSDDEPELRDKIVSVSLGATRTFALRDDPLAQPLSIPLEHGSVLVMTVESQRLWQHSVPREAVAGRRINLTFRTIAPA